MTTIGFGLRFAHLATSVLLVGAFSTILLAGRSDRPTAMRWEASLVACARWLALVAVVSGVGILVFQTVVFESRTSAAHDPRAIARVMLDTRFGLVWVARQALLVVLGALLLFRLDLRRLPDWVAMREESLLLGAVALTLASFAGHAAAVAPGITGAIVVDTLHLLGTGLWAGGLIPLAMLLFVASRASGADARPLSVLVARRFSRLALIAMLSMLATGVVNTIVEVGSLPGLIGTAHGRLLLVKLGLLLPILALAAVNRRRLVPALSGPADTVGRPAMQRLATFVSIEAVLALAILAIVAVMTTTAPARHQQPDWPLPFRLTWDAVADSPGARARVIVASQIAVLGVVAALASLVPGRRRWAALAAGLVVAVLAAGAAVPALAVAAYPTSFWRPAVPYTAVSIATGRSLYTEHCARCHGATADAASDGVDRRGATPPRATTPTDARSMKFPTLLSRQTARRTAGDLFWWITHGDARSGMPAFGAELGDAERWDLVNFVRAFGAADAARGLGPTVGRERPWLVAPDFSFSVGPTPARALRDRRGSRVVLLVLYTLPGSRPRLAQLAERYALLTSLEMEIIAAPTDAAPDAIRRLGDEPRVLFPIVTDGAADIVRTYGLFAPRAPHAEFLIDRQGYIRARWTASADETRDVALLLADAERLNQEKPAGAPPDEHVH